MTPTIELMLAHRSIRHYTPEPIAAGQLQAVLAAAQSAASSSFLQPVSVIRVTDPAQRQALVALCGQQAYVAEAPEFLVFCADFYRHSRIVPEALTGFAEQLLIGAIDGALMGQNALLAAESLGLGGVFIGAIRNQPDEVTTLLGLPKLVIPLFGLCLGHPAREPALKPRLPAELVVHENRYQTEPDPALLAGYDAHMQDYYAHRGSNQKAESWSSQITRILRREARPFMMDYLHRQGFNLK